MIKWITDEIGTAAMNSIDKEQFEGAIVDVRDMVDKSGNRSIIINEKINKAIEFLESGKKVVICCDYGISRSNAIAAGLLAKWENVSFNTALKQVIEKTNEKSLKLEVISAVRRAIEEDQVKNNQNIKKNISNVLLTGGSGFLGTALRKTRQDKFNIFAPSRQKIDLLSGYIDLDLIVKENNIKCLIHFANPRIYSINRSMGETLTMLKNVLDVCKENKIKLIYLSTWEIYSGYTKKSLVASETLKPFPKGTYGETKYFCEKLIQLYKENFGIKYAIIRSSPVYGLGSDSPKFIFNFLKKAINNEDIVTHKYFNGFPHLDLLHIRDIINVISSCLECDYAGELNVGSGKLISTADVAKIIVELLRSKSHIYHAEIQDYAPNILMDCNLAKDKLGWCPEKKFEDGIKEIIIKNKPKVN